MAMVELKLDSERYYDIPELVKSMGVTKWTIRRWIKAGKLKAHKVGRKYFVSSEGLRELLEGRPKPEGKRSTA
jgi:excisionase family DNA binding protein